jgi:hypothetical protein
VVCEHALHVQGSQAPRFLGRTGQCDDCSGGESRGRLLAIWRCKRAPRGVWQLRGRFASGGLGGSFAADTDAAEPPSSSRPHACPDFQPSLVNSQIRDPDIHPELAIGSLGAGAPMGDCKADPSSPHRHPGSRWTILGHRRPRIEAIDQTAGSQTRAGSAGAPPRHDAWGPERLSRNKARTLRRSS